MFNNLSLTTPVGRLRAVAMLEGLSFLILLFIAMPLKYLAHNHMPVKITGMVHGMLFLGFILCLLLAMRAAKLPFKLAVLAFVASLLPFGPFVLDKKLEHIPQG